MNYNTVYVGMDVHKESFTLCAYTIDAEKGSHFQRTEADYKNVLKYLEFLRTVYGNDANFICGYEAGCLGYTLYHQLTANNVKCIILAPTTMLEQRSRRTIDLQVTNPRISEWPMPGTDTPRLFPGAFRQLNKVLW